MFVLYTLNENYKYQHPFTTFYKFILTVSSPPTKIPPFRCGFRHWVSLPGCVLRYCGVRVVKYRSAVLGDNCAVIAVCHLHFGRHYTHLLISWRSIVLKAIPSNKLNTFISFLLINLIYSIITLLLLYVNIQKKKATIKVALFSTNLYGGKDNESISNFDYIIANICKMSSIKTAEKYFVFL